MVHGSGNETRADNLPVAELLAGRGVAALVYDKRGTGASGGDWHQGDYGTLAEDALAALRALREHRAIDAGAVGLWGVSEGGWVVPLAASRSDEPAFLVVVSAAAMSPARQELYRRTRAAAGAGGSPLRAALVGIGWRLVCLTAPALALAPNRLLPDKGLVCFFARTRNFDPLPVWRRVRQPVLGLWGSADEAVPAAVSAARVEATLRAGGNPDATTRLFPDADHLIRVQDGDYAPGYIETTATWVLARSPRSSAAAPSVSRSPNWQHDSDVSLRRSGAD